MRSFRTRVISVVAFSTMLGAALGPVTGIPAAAQSSDTIKIGLLATLTGPFAQLGADGMRGAQTAVDEFNGQAGGKKIVVVKESSDATPNVARDAARKLIEQDNVDFMVGPLSGDEGIAVRDYAKTVPAKTFINGSSGAEDTTLFDPAPNFFRWNTDGVQWMAGLGTYALKDRHYKRVVTLGEDYSFPYSQVGGFTTEFCKAGGHVLSHLWVPLGTKDFSSVISSIPHDVDAVYVALGGADGLNFLKQYVQFGGKAPLIGGSITVDQTMLSTKGNLYEHVIGVPAAGPIADDDPSPAWKAFVAEYRKQAGALPSPSLFAHAYYLNTKAALLALNAVHGDLSNNQAAFRAAMAKLAWNSPTGPVHLDGNRQAVGDIYLTVVAKRSDGVLVNKLVRVTHQVNETLGIPMETYMKRGKLSRDTPPACP
jgi:branched-chain amino acid transport system substrate-binding protein